MSLRIELEQIVSAWAARNFPDLPPEPWVRPCTDERHGHFQTHLAMVAAKATKQNPRDLAERLCKECFPPEGWEKPAVAGAGFVNYRVGPEAVGHALDALRRDPDLGIPKVTKPETIVIDFSSPNIAKAMHVGHIRSTLLGDSLARLLTRLGHRVTRVNHLGDWGTQFGKLLLAYRAAGRPPIESDRAIDQLEEFYKQGHQQAESDPAKMEQARAELAALQVGDPERLQDWRLFCEKSAEHFRRIYERLDVRFDSVRGESAYHEDLPGVVQDLLDKDIAETSQGAVVVRNPEIAEEPYLIRKSDGAFLYATTDLAAIRYRAAELKADRIIYVTDARQQLHSVGFLTRPGDRAARRSSSMSGLEPFWAPTGNPSKAGMEPLSSCST